jgi:hypothetical protein
MLAERAIQVGYTLLCSRWLHWINTKELSVQRTPSLGHLLSASCVALTLSLVGNAHAGDTTAQAQLAYWSAQAGQPGQVHRGDAFFNAKHGQDWSCASCHGTPPTSVGQHASTGKTIKPLAPAFNSQSFTQTSKVNKWFRRNCGDVLTRDCSAQEKADVLAYLLSLKPRSPQ